jgi:hypothetical protein
MESSENKRVFDFEKLEKFTIMKLYGKVHIIVSNLEGHRLFIVPLEQWTVEILNGHLFVVRPRRWGESVQC